MTGAPAVRPERLGGDLELLKRVSGLALGNQHGRGSNPDSNKNLTAQIPRLNANVKT